MKIFNRTPLASTGFSLIEMLITMTIIGILASIAYPSYTRHVQKANRVEAQTALLGILTKQQNYFGRNMTYTTSLKDDLGYNADPFITEGGHYSIVAEKCGSDFSDKIADCVKLTATAKGSQVSDGDLTINSAGVKTPADKW